MATRRGVTLRLILAQVYTYLLPVGHDEVTDYVINPKHCGKAVTIQATVEC